MSVGIGVGFVVDEECPMVEVDSEVNGMVEVSEGITVSMIFSSFSSFSCPLQAEMKVHMMQTKMTIFLIALLQKSIVRYRFIIQDYPPKNISPNRTGRSQLT